MLWVSIAVGILLLIVYALYLFMRWEGGSSTPDLEDTCQHDWEPGFDGYVYCTKCSRKESAGT